MLVVPAAPAVATTYRYFDDTGASTITREPPKGSYAVLDDAGEFLWYVHDKPIPVTHWKPFWIEPEPDPFDVPFIRPRIPLVTIEELEHEDTEAK